MNNDEQAKGGGTTPGDEQTNGDKQANPDPQKPGVSELADRLLKEAMESLGIPDPRPLNREHLRQLQATNPTSYQEAVTYYREELLPQVAAGSDPLAAWADFGRAITGLLVEGEAVSVSTSGAAQPYQAPAGPEELILHLPHGRGPARLISMPIRLSPAQAATLALLVEGRKQL